MRPKQAICVYCAHCVRGDRGTLFCNREGLKYHPVHGGVIGPTCEDERSPDRAFVAMSRFSFRRDLSCMPSGIFWKQRPGHDAA